ncbi:hypothetical protein GCM10011506_07010 [Marivirga lumbricoides]|uniref:Uncharacterized protein n=1 Tax=Marivirga lumbricoides TaxID=1046115 RepID=A0ABQ1LGJ4_9BACT|nr:hypothetical protein GCM10011506_07010 [Marivirga lumbricoides]
MRNIDLKLDIHESDFIHWFQESIDRPGFLENAIDKSDKNLFGQLNEKEFWIEKKNKFFFKGRFSPFGLDLSSISGIYEIGDNSIQLYLRIMLKPQIRNIVLPGVLIWTLVGFYQYFAFKNTWTIQLAGMLWLGIAFIIWRINADAKLIRKYIKEQFE